MDAPSWEPTVIFCYPLRCRASDWHQNLPPRLIIWYLLGKSFLTALGPHAVDVPDVVLHILSSVCHVPFRINLYFEMPTVVCHPFIPSNRAESNLIDFIKWTNYIVSCPLNWIRIQSHRGRLTIQANISSHLVTLARSGRGGNGRPQTHSG